MEVVKIEGKFYALIYFMTFQGEIERTLVKCKSKEHAEREVRKAIEQVAECYANQCEFHAWRMSRINEYLAERAARKTRESQQLEFAF